MAWLGSIDVTKKYFEAITTHNKRKAEFVVPLRQSGELDFVSIKTGVITNRFVSVFTGIELTPKLIWAKMVDAGLVIENVELTLSDLTKFLEVSSMAKLGYVYEKAEDTADFELIRLGKL